MNEENTTTPDKLSDAGGVESSVLFSDLDEAFCAGFKAYMDHVTPDLRCLEIMQIRHDEWKKFRDAKHPCKLEGVEWDHDWEEKHDSSGECDGGRGDEWTWKECRTCGITEEEFIKENV